MALNRTRPSSGGDAVHKLVVSEPLTWCFVCGGYAESAPLLLTRPCTRRPRQDKRCARRRQLLSLRAGKHPETKIRLLPPVHLSRWKRQHEVENTPGRACGSSELGDAHRLLTPVAAPAIIDDGTAFTRAFLNRGRTEASDNSTTATDRIRKRLASSGISGGAKRAKNGDDSGRRHSGNHEAANSQQQGQRRHTANGSTEDAIAASDTSALEQRVGLISGSTGDSHGATGSLVPGSRMREPTRDLHRICNGLGLETDRRPCLAGSGAGGDGGLAVSRSPPSKSGQVRAGKANYVHCSTMRTAEPDEHDTAPEQGEQRSERPEQNLEESSSSTREDAGPTCGTAIVPPSRPLPSPANPSSLPLTPCPNLHPPRDNRSAERQEGGPGDLHWHCGDERAQQLQQHRADQRARRQQLEQAAE